MRRLLQRRARSRLRRVADSVPYWFHSIDLGGGVVTNGARSADDLARSLAELHLPDLSGKTFLDIGAWDGFYSFAAERLGARRIVALDHYVWKGVPRPWDRPLSDLPDKRLGFSVAHKALGSRVESWTADFTTMDLAELGTFDVVLFAGVLYHLQNPCEALQRVAQVTGELAVIETAAVFVPGFEEFALCEFYETDQLGSDATNWWAPNAKALCGMCRAAGFDTANVMSGSLEENPVAVDLKRHRLIAHASKFEHADTLGIAS